MSEELTHYDYCLLADAVGSYIREINRNLAEGLFSLTQDQRDALDAELSHAVRLRVKIREGREATRKMSAFT